MGAAVHRPAADHRNHLPRTAGHGGTHRTWPVPPSPRDDWGGFPRGADARTAGFRGLRRPGPARGGSSGDRRRDPAVLVVPRAQSRPLHITALAASAESVAHGNYDIGAPGEFGTELTLSRAFQDMAESLASTDEARTQLLSDLSHEIRTPLAVYIVGMEDGVVPPSAANFEVMRAEVHRLRRLARLLFASRLSLCQ